MAKMLVEDELWAIVKPLLPEWQPSSQGAQPRKSDRMCLIGILFALKTGTSGKTSHKRWAAAV